MKQMLASFGLRERDTHLPRSAIQVTVAFACCVLLAACGATTSPSDPGTSAPQTGNATLQLLTMDSAHVAAVRDSLRRGDTQFAPALNSLQANANTGLNFAPVSVMDKNVTPPSGDKHDYMSQAPYYWPNPSTPDGLPYIRKDGQRNPEIDKITDRANLQRLARTAITLAVAYYFTGRQEYAQHAADLVRAWFLDPSTRMNPNLNFGQGIPGIAKGRAAGIVETRFLPDIIDAMTLLQGSAAWSGTDDQGLKKWMRAYLTWLQENRLGQEESTRGNNQETWYEVQVVSLALYTGQPEVARTTLRQSQTAIGKEFEPDGSQPRELARTRSWDYSIFDLTAFLRVAALGSRVGVDLWNYETTDGRSLRKGVDFLVPFATGEKRWPYKQITPLHGSALHPVLRWAAVGWKDPNYRATAQQIGGATPLLELTMP
jgi:Alginate lyase